MAQVFVSYSNSDDREVRHALAPLRSAGVSVWFAPDQGRIPGGADYATSIVDALNGCRAVVLMATEKSLASRHVGREMELAVKRNLPIIPLFLERGMALPPAFEYRLALQQRIDAHDRTGTAWAEALLAALRHHGVMPAAGQSKGGQSYVLPYLADRDTQEHLIEDRLTEHLRHAPQRPIAFVVHGTHAQCTDFFGDRLLIHAFPGMLGNLIHSTTLERKSIQWPNTDIDTARRLRTYARFVTTKLEIGPNSAPDEIARKIGTLRQPVVFHSSLTAAEWPQAECELLQAIANFWAGLPDVPSPSQPLMLLLCVRYPDTEISVLERFLRRNNVKRPPVGMPEMLAELQTKNRKERRDPPGIELVVLPQLSNVSLGDVEAWVENVLKPADKDRVLAIVRALFTSPRKKAEKVIDRYLASSKNELSTDLERILRIPPMRCVPMEPLVPFLNQFLSTQNRMRRL